jgi:hypothetical protein
MLDYIPLTEIIGIEYVHQDESVESGTVLFDTLKTVSFANAFQIQTTPDGYNSGRKYLFQAETETERDQLVHDLRCRVKHASNLLISSFRRSQIRVRRIYNSVVVQSIAAFLIVLVCLFVHIFAIRYSITQSRPFSF